MSWKAKFGDSNLSESSKKNYIYNVTKILKTMGTDDVTWVMAHPRETMKALRRAHKNPTIRSQVCAIVSLFKHWEEMRLAHPEAKETWSKYMKDLDKQAQAPILEGQASERELLNWVPWRQVLKAEKKLRKTQYGSDTHLLLAMYTCIEPARADYGNIKVFVEDTPDSPSGNYMVLRSKKESYLVLNEYKTKKALGEFNRPLPHTLVKIIVHNMTANPRTHLFVKCDGQPYDKKNSFDRYANRILYDIFKKHFTISLLRHSFISGLDFNGTTPGQLLGHAKNMMHSAGQQQLYRRMVPETTVVLQEEAERRPVKDSVKRQPPPPPPPAEASGSRVLLI